MRRRVRDEEVPPQLATFVPGDWPGRTDEDRLRFWKEARRMWGEEHGWPGGALERIRVEFDTRRHMQGLPTWSWGRTPAEVDAINRAAGIGRTPTWGDPDGAG